MCILYQDWLSWGVDTQLSTTQGYLFVDIYRNMASRKWLGSRHYRFFVAHLDQIDLSQLPVRSVSEESVSMSTTSTVRNTIILYERLFTRDFELLTILLCPLFLQREFPPAVFHTCVHLSQGKCFERVTVHCTCNSQSLLDLSWRS